MIEIKLEKLWQYAPGTIVLVDGKKMLYVGKTEDMVMQLYDYESGLVEYCEGEDWNWDSVIVVIGRDLDQLIVCQEFCILGLIQDGWLLGEGCMGLESEMATLSALVRLKQVMNGVL